MEKPTSARLLAVLAGIGFVLGSLIANLVESSTGRLFPVPWTTPALMVSFAVALLLWTLSIRPRLQRKTGTVPVPGPVAIRTAALALAASRVSAVVGGSYLGIGVALLPAWETLAGRAYVVASGLTVLSSAAAVAVALWLESACRLPPPDDEAAAPA